MPRPPQGGPSGAGCVAWRLFFVFAKRSQFFRLWHRVVDYLLDGFDFVETAGVHFQAGRGLHRGNEFAVIGETFGGLFFHSGFRLDGFADQSRGLQAAEFGEIAFDGALAMRLGAVDGGVFGIGEVESRGGFGTAAETPGGVDDFSDAEFFDGTNGCEVFVEGLSVFGVRHGFGSWLGPYNAIAPELDWADGKPLN